MTRDSSRMSRRLSHRDNPRDGTRDVLHQSQSQSQSQSPFLYVTGRGLANHRPAQPQTARETKRKAMNDTPARRPDDFQEQP